MILPKRGTFSLQLHNLGGDVPLLPTGSYVFETIIYSRLWWVVYGLHSFSCLTQMTIQAIQPSFFTQEKGWMDEMDDEMDERSRQRMNRKSTFSSCDWHHFRQPQIKPYDKPSWYSKQCNVPSCDVIKKKLDFVILFSVLYIPAKLLCEWYRQQNGGYNFWVIFRDQRKHLIVTITKKQGMKVGPNYVE